MNQSQILVVDDDSQLREAIVDTLMLTGYACIEASSGEEALSTLAKRNVDMVISDIQMGGMDGHTLLKSIHDKYPQLPVLLMTAYANIDGAVRAMRDGAIDYLAKPFAPEVLLNQVSRYVPVKRITKREPIWNDPSTGELLKMAAKVAASDATVMITGPSGSGKEVLSRYVHDNSPRASGPFVAINCAAIPDTMLESTLFGYEKGAFTGAIQACPGKFEQAQGGTILLDEITEMDLNLQSKLLRVLQEKEVERLGGRKTIALDVRVIATSNRDLKQAVLENKFREDLYYRLNVFPLRWMPLFQRKGDVVPLAKFFLQRHATENSRAIPELTAQAIERLENYSWPGNVRELENVMQRALILSDGNRVEAKDLILDEGINPRPTQNMEGVAPMLNQEQQQHIPAPSSNGNFINHNYDAAAQLSGISNMNGTMQGMQGNMTASMPGAMPNMVGMNNGMPNAMGMQGMAPGVPQVNGVANGVGVPNGVANMASMPNNMAPNAMGQANMSQPNMSQANMGHSNMSTAAASSMEAVRNQRIPSNLGGELKQQEYQIILDALIDCRGNRQAVAERLGISPRTLRYKIAKMREEGMIIPS